MTASPSAIVSEFLRAFLSGEADKARAMTCDDFFFHAPMHQGRGGREAYFAGTREKAKLIRGFRILRQWEDGDQVATIYELDLGTEQNHATMAMSEWHCVRDGRIGSVFMIFDTGAKAVQIMRDALHSRSSTQ